MEPEFALTREQIRELDRIAIEQYGIPGLILMENAGSACARTALRMLGSARGKEVTLLCGRGNNGGDGFVVARHLSNAGARCRLLLLGERQRVLKGGGDNGVNLRIALNMEIPLQETGTVEKLEAALEDGAGCSLLVDALLGTGVSGEVREPFRGAIQALNRMEAPVLAVDVPSGLDCDTGRPLGEAVRADRTVTFGVNKVGLARPEAANYTGPVEVAPISIPRPEIERKLEASRWEDD